jgi:hypothetical protein
MAGAPALTLKPCMKKQITVAVIKPFEGHEVGDMVTCSPIQAIVWRRKGFVRIGRGYEPKVIQPEPVPTRRQYRRRDMTPEAA